MIFPKSGAMIDHSKRWKPILPPTAFLAFTSPDKTPVDDKFFARCRTGISTVPDKGPGSDFPDFP
jgi:hypothetical protein